MRWYEVTVTGQDAHTGATPMHLRKNALLGAARLIERIDAIAREHAPGVGTVGLIENKPNSRNVVPGEVFFCVDLRHPDGRALDAMEAAFTAALPDVCGPLGLGVDEQRIWDQPGGALRSRMRRCGAPRGGAFRLFGARHRFRAPATTRPTCRASRRPR